MNRALDKTFEDNDKLIKYIKIHNINVTVITFTIHFGWLGRKWDFSRFSFQLRIISGTQVIDSLRTEDSRPGLIGMSPPGKRNNIQLIITILLQVGLIICRSTWAILTIPLINLNKLLLSWNQWTSNRDSSTLSFTGNCLNCCLQSCLIR